MKTTKDLKSLNIDKVVTAIEADAGHTLPGLRESLAEAKTSKSAPAGQIPADGTTPHEVMRLGVKNDWSMIRAWREHLGLTQADMASRLEIRQPSYAAMEAPNAKPKKTTRERIAAAMGLSLEQLEF